MEPYYTRVFPTKEVAGIVDVSPSSIRKYCQALESHGYEFKRSEDGARIIYAHDVDTIKAMRRRIRRGESYESAAQNAAEDAKTYGVGNAAPGDQTPAEGDNKPITERERRMIEILEGMSADIAGLRQEIAELRQETKEAQAGTKAIASPQEAPETTQEVDTKAPGDEPKPKGWIRRLFGK